MPFKRWIHFRPDDGTGAGDGGGGGGTGDGAGSGSGESQGDNSAGAGTSDAERELATVRQEAAARRKENTDLKKRIEELEGAGKTELEKREAAIQDLTGTTQTLQATNRALRVRVLAGQAGISDPKAAADAASLLDWSTVTDPESEVAVVKALKELVKDRPYLGGNIAGGGDGGEGGGDRGSGSSDMNQLIRNAAGR